jgi:hypothetical protein
MLVNNNTHRLNNSPSTSGLSSAQTEQGHTDTRLFNTSTTALNPGAVLSLSLSPSSTIPNNLPVSWMRREMSDVNVNEDPNAGFMEVAENRERGLVGTLVAWAFNTYPQLSSSSVSISSRGQGRDSRKW